MIKHFERGHAPCGQLLVVSEIFRDSVMKKAEGRDKFLARVAANSLDIVSRELALAPGHLQGELNRLQKMFSSNQDLVSLGKAS